MIFLFAILTAHTPLFGWGTSVNFASVKWRSAETRGLKAQARSEAEWWCHKAVTRRAK
jgi:hypothetical protein